MTVSVAIPVYNGEHYLGEAIESVQRQTRGRRTSASCSTTAPPTARVEIAEAALGPRAVRTSEVNLGAVANFNRAVEEATGDLLRLARCRRPAGAALHRAVPSRRARRTRRRRLPPRHPVHRPRRARDSASSATPTWPRPTPGPGSARS